MGAPEDEAWRERLDRQPDRGVVSSLEAGGSMLDFATLQRFVTSLGPEGAVSLQNVDGRVVEVSAGVPDIHELIEVRATHFKIMNRP